MRSKPGLLAAIIASIAALGSAHGQDGRAFTDISIERFALATTGTGVLAVEGPAVLSLYSASVGLSLSYSNDPLILHDLTTDERVGALVADRWQAELVGAVVVYDGLQLGLRVPLVLSQSSELEGMVTPASLDGYGLGDVQLTPKYQLLEESRHHLDLAVAAAVSLPTQVSADYSGDDFLRVEGLISVARRFEWLRAIANLGYRFRERRRTGNLVVDDELIASLGLGYGLGWLGVPLEFQVSAQLATGADDFFGPSNRNYSEVLGGVSYGVHPDLVVFAAAGGGTSSGYGTPDWRVLGGARWSWAKQPPPLAPAPVVDGDRDGDGLLDSVDRCPGEAEDRDGFEDEDGCPDTNNDQDGIPDATDRCPLRAEDPDGFRDDDGCPDLDNDLDMVPDSEDRCPMQAGEPEDQGCPKDVTAPTGSR